MFRKFSGAMAAGTLASIAFVWPVPLIAQSKTELPQRQVGRWQTIDGSARDVGVGANGHVWIIGTNALPGGYEVLRLENDVWKRIIAIQGLPGAVRIDATPEGSAFIVNSNNDIYFYYPVNQPVLGFPSRVPPLWIKLPGKATDIGVGADKSVWMIGVHEAPGGNCIFRWNGVEWTNIPGGALRIDVAPDGNAWVVDKSGDVYHYTKSGWSQKPGRTAIDIGIGPEGDVWIAGTDGEVYKWDEDLQWISSGAVGKTVQNISAGPAGPPGHIWGTTESGDILRRVQPSTNYSGSARNQKSESIAEPKISVQDYVINRNAAQLKGISKVSGDGATNSTGEAEATDSSSCPSE